MDEDAMTPTETRMVLDAAWKAAARGDDHTLVAILRDALEALDDVIAQRAKAEDEFQAWMSSLEAHARAEADASRAHAAEQRRQALETFRGQQARQQAAGMVDDGSWQG